MKIHKRNTKCRPNYAQNKKNQKKKSKLTEELQTEQGADRNKNLNIKQAEAVRKEGEPEQIGSQKEAEETKIYSEPSISSKIKPVFIPSKEGSLI